MTSSNTSRASLASTHLPFTAFVAASIASFLATAATPSVHAAANPFGIQTIAINYDPGNAPDTTGYGAVSYAYEIGKYEVTNAQYVAFLNAVDPTGANSLGLYHTGMTTSVFGGINAWTAGDGYTIKSDTDTNGYGYANKPVAFVSFWDAARFVNYLTSGDTESGSYDFGTYANANESTLTANNASILRSENARWVIPTENEWYKAAYYDPNKGGAGVAGYWAYPSTNDTTPGYANYGSYIWDNQNATQLLPVNPPGIVAAASGTSGQGGGLAEWNETASGANRGTRGGSIATSATSLISTARQDIASGTNNNLTGFRIVYLVTASGPVIPEPAATAAIFAALVGSAGAYPRFRRAGVLVREK
jgi:formylglycine-generating enzyme required for sulfatase activity